MGVRVGFAEVEPRAQVKQAGGKWNGSRKVWELRYDHVVALKLEARIVEEKASNSRYKLEKRSIHAYPDVEQGSTRFIRPHCGHTKPLGKRAA